MTAREHLNALKEAVKIVAELLPHLHEVTVAGEPELVHQAPLPVELYPVVHPAVGLRGGPARVVHWKPKLAGLGLW
eukprot:scaffold143116_cov24-Prasinocladus_malaysianus.AAC.1